MTPRNHATLPNYRWPAHLISWRTFPTRLLAAITFRLAYFTGWLTWFFRRNPSTILIIRTDGLGDCLLFEPALRAIAAHFSDHQIHLWAPKAVCELYEGMTYLSRRVEIPRGYKDGCLAYFSSFKLRASIGWTLGRTHFDTVIYPTFSPEPLGNFLFSATRATRRNILSGDLENQFDWQREATLPYATRILPMPPQPHDLDRNATLAKSLGAAHPTDCPKIDLPSPSLLHANAQLSLWRNRSSHQNPRGLIGIVVGGSMNKFQYPKEKWTRLLSEIWSRHRLLPVFLNTSSSPHLHLDAPVNVSSLTAIIAGLDAILTLDTGPAHIAASLRIPTVVLSNGGHPNRFFPYPNALWVKSLIHTMSCQGCLCRCPLAEAECLTKIPENEVLSALNQVLHQIPLPETQAA